MFSFHDKIIDRIVKENRGYLCCKKVNLIWRDHVDGVKSLPNQSLFLWNHINIHITIVDHIVVIFVYYFDIIISIL